MAKIGFELAKNGQTLTKKMERKIIKAFNQ